MDNINWKIWAAAFVILVVVLSVLICNQYGFFLAGKEGERIIFSPPDKAKQLEDSYTAQGERKNELVKATVDSLAQQTTLLKQELNRRNWIIDSLVQEKATAPNMTQIIEAYKATIDAYAKQVDSLKMEIANRDTLIQNLRQQIVDMQDWNKYVMQATRETINEVMVEQGILDQAYKLTADRSLFGRKERRQQAKQKYQEAIASLENLEQRLQIDNLFDDYTNKIRTVMDQVGP